MKANIRGYMRYEDFEDDCERYDYLNEVHRAMAEQLFDWHGLRLATPEKIWSIGYICGRDVDLCFETCFDESGDTCHRAYDMFEARRLLDKELSDFRAREAEIQERRSQIRLVKSNQGPDS